MVVFFSYYLTSYYFIKKKEKIFFKCSNVFLKFNFSIKYFSDLNEKLINLEYPYKLNIYKVVFIKFFAIVIFFVSLIKNNNMIFSIIVCLFCYFFPNILIHNFKIAEKKKIIKDILTLILNLDLTLSVGHSLYNSLKFSINSLEYLRFKRAMFEFVEEYKIYNFDVLKAAKKLLNKFNITEIKMLIDILCDDKSIRNISDLLSTFKESITIKINNNLKIYYSKETYSILFFTVSLLIISFVIVIYPISAQVMNSLNIILS